MKARQAKEQRPVNRFGKLANIVPARASKRGPATAYEQPELARLVHQRLLAAERRTATADLQANAMVIHPCRAMILTEMEKVPAKPLAKLRRLNPERRRLLARACLILSAASAAVALLPFRRAVRFGCVPRRSRSDLLIEDCVWAVAAAARRLPWRTLCIEQGLAVQRMLRRSGTDALLHYGARHDPVSGALEAHVWVSVDGQAVIGGEDARHYAEVACYP